MKDFFHPQNASVKTSRILYTPSVFARTSLLYLQEVGSLEALYPHTSTRENLVSFLFFVVTSGEGKLTYDHKEYDLQQGDCVFIDCKKAYSHSTSEHLWTLDWVHFYSSTMSSIYDKYLERGGKPVFHVSELNEFTGLIHELYDLASSSDYIRDMRINEKLSSLLTLIMKESWNPDAKMTSSRKRLELENIKNYLDEHYTEHISLEDLSNQFFINKFYLTKIFKETYGITINNYLISKRITKAKQYLRFTDMTVDEIGQAIGISDVNYFCRMFKKVEGMSPTTYKKKW